MYGVTTLRKLSTRLFNFINNNSTSSLKEYQNSFEDLIKNGKNEKKNSISNIRYMHFDNINIYDINIK